MDILGSFGGSLIKAVMSVKSVMAIFNWMGTILDGVMSVLGPVIDEVLTPLVGILRIVGKVIGSMLVPVVRSLTPVIEFIGKAFVWLYNNAIKPFANLIIKAGNVFHNFIADLVNFFIGAINGIIKLINRIPGISIATINSYMKKTAIGAGTLGDITYADLGAAGYEAIGGEQTYGGGTTSTGGGGANYTAGRTITMNVTINTDVITGETGGLRQLAILIRDEIKSAEALGV